MKKINYRVLLMWIAAIFAFCVIAITWGLIAMIIGLDSTLSQWIGFLVGVIAYFVVKDIGTSILIKYDDWFSRGW